MEARRMRGRWTYAEFARLPSEGTARQEVIDDELVVTPAPSLLHQRIVTDLVAVLNTFVRDHDLGQVFSAPVDVLLGEGDYLEPDIVFVRRERAGILSDRGIEGPPDLVVEVVSPASAGRDRGIKLHRYRHFGVPEYWIVDPDGRVVEVWAFAGGATEAIVLGPEDALRWSPEGGAVAMEISVGEMLPGA